ncbi:MAG: B12-binding domain-containing radical SAM protein [Burkholderiaceae bacterium]|nr:B12-binding domain-containing radical SAM protein [Burkholderiaceae bacterium]
MAEILLTTINTRYAHASLGLRCLHANLGALARRAAIVEFVSGARTETMLERLLAERPRVVAIGVYIWNVLEATRLVAQMRRVAPQVRIVLGGPEVSHETDEQRICSLADHVVTGPGEASFARLAAQLLDGSPPCARVIAGKECDPATLELPYPLYSDRDIAQRHLFVEASRGCPFRCEFCLSALDRGARPFPLERVLEQLRALHARGARRFRFVDRTFNLKTGTSLAILEFFQGCLRAAPHDPVFAHFELIPDRLPAPLRSAIASFAPGTIQLEIGIQTWNPQVQALISRRQDNDAAEENLRWLRTSTGAHLHVDLIAGLPGEDLASFGAGFDRLVAIAPQEIQLGILKRLRGAPIARHTESHGLRFNPDPPYNVLATDAIAFEDMQRIARFSRYWEIFANSGRFPRALALLLGDAPFARFMQFCDWVWTNSDATHAFALRRQRELLAGWLGEQPGIADELSGVAPRVRRPASSATPPRQARHLA